MQVEIMCVSSGHGFKENQFASPWKYDCTTDHTDEGSVMGGVGRWNNERKRI